ncbi:hypothetical protein DMO24_21080 [Modestobacter versicolor]|uniref:Uncharacterized protein n=1 Tax=Modestobacter versicolor TaxID=429133 RepID=A0A323VGH8_9ACTN|nr:hypothetical protein DMO24_21080 [Modestobacter versicolor]
MVFSTHLTNIPASRSTQDTASAIATTRNTRATVRESVRAAGMALLGQASGGVGPWCRAGLCELARAPGSTVPRSPGATGAPCDVRRAGSYPTRRIAVIEPM